jgi:hypothetical protein
LAANDIAELFGVAFIKHVEIEQQGAFDGGAFG